MSQRLQLAIHVTPFLPIVVSNSCTVSDVRRFLSGCISKVCHNTYPQIIGGRIPAGSSIVIIERTEVPHHMLLLRYSMVQALLYSQLSFFVCPLPSR
uniref:Uncharacterized protein n=1 Tax=Physcomitrium patens TaxID=3218 RepID=A0A7I3Z6J4_PHYPA